MNENECQPRRSLGATNGTGYNTINESTDFFIALLLSLSARVQ
jgi:hypothetical protein